MGGMEMNGQPIPSFFLRNPARIVHRREPLKKKKKKCGCVGKRLNEALMRLGFWFKGAGPHGENKGNSSGMSGNGWRANMTIWSTLRLGPPGCIAEVTQPPARVLRDLYLISP